MQLDEARGFAAHAWCEDANSGKVLDVDLAESFAHILMTRVNEAVQSHKIREARRVMRSALAGDAGFRQGYIANVAMLLHDHYGITDYEKRNKAAEEILDLIFG